MCFNELYYTFHDATFQSMVNGILCILALKPTVSGHHRRRDVEEVCFYYEIEKRLNGPSMGRFTLDIN